MQHNHYLTRGAEWGAFLDVRRNAAALYRKQFEKERAWGRKSRDQFSIFLSSSTDPFLPQERKEGITRSVLEAMLDRPPDELIIQTHSDRVLDCAGLLEQLDRKCNLRIHISIEGDRERLPGLPPPACSIDRRMEAASLLKRRGISVVITVAPLHPLADPIAFFTRIASCSDAVVIDHFIEGDGSKNGSRTQRTELPTAMEVVDSTCTSLDYREQIVALARGILPGRVGVSMEGFAGRYLPD